MAESRRCGGDMNNRATRPWGALWAMLIGHFMTLIDWTAVSVANPSIMAALHTDYAAVIWVTSAYLLGFAVPLMASGRPTAAAPAPPMPIFRTTSKSIRPTPRCRSSRESSRRNTRFVAIPRRSTDSASALFPELNLSSHPLHGMAQLWCALAAFTDLEQR
jgi:hypothetical protein